MSDQITLPRELVFRAVKVLSPMAYDTWPKERNEVVKALRDRLAAPPPQPVAAQHRFRHPQKTMPNWCKWHECRVRNRPAWEIDSQGYEVEYRLLYAAPPPAPPAAAPEQTHPGYVIGSHWLETAYSRICAGEVEADVLRDYKAAIDAAMQKGDKT